MWDQKEKDANSIEELEVFKGRLAIPVVEEITMVPDFSYFFEKDHEQKESLQTQQDSSYVQPNNVVAAIIHENNVRFYHRLIYGDEKPVNCGIVPDPVSEVTLEEISPSYTERKNKFIETLENNTAELVTEGSCDSISEKQVTEKALSVEDKLIHVLRELVGDDFERVIYWEDIYERFVREYQESSEVSFKELPVSKKMNSLAAKYGIKKEKLLRDGHKGELVAYRNFENLFRGKEELKNS